MKLALLVALGALLACTELGKVAGEKEVVELVKRDALDDVISQTIEGLRSKRAKKECQRLMQPIETTIAELGQQLERASATLVVAVFDLSSIFNDVRAKKVEEEYTQFDELMLRQSAICYDILQGNRDRLKECNKTALRMMELCAKFNALVPVSAEDRKKLTSLTNEISRKFANSSVEKDGKKYSLVPDLDLIMERSRDYEELLWAWRSWYDVAGKAVKKDFVEIVELTTRAAKDRGYSDVAQVWQMSDFEEDMEGQMDELMKVIKPLYKQLHAHVRNKLFDFYGAKVKGEKLKKFFANKSNPMPIHLLGNMYGMVWSSIADLVLPFPAIKYDVDAEMKRQKYTVDKMFKMAEEFFTSLGLDPMTQTFWKKSVFERVPNVTMDCHASAYDMFLPDDFRIHMCSTVSLSDFRTVHHEMGHIVYYMQYRPLYPSFRSGANAAFHEAIGDTIALSVTSDEHLKKVGLLPKVEQKPKENNLNNLMRTALDKIVFLPFAYTIEKWRNALFRGEFTPEMYNQKWWKQMLEDGGIAPSVDRSDTSLFDAGAKYHIPSFVPYARYFFSFIGQFQFHEALCTKAGHHGHLSRCNIHASRAAGELLKSVLEKGSMFAWRDVIGQFTGSKNFNASSILRYFEPLHQWLIEQNKGVPVGWSSG